MPEIAFVTASRLRVEVEARRGGVAGQVVMRFLRDPATFLTTTLVGTNLALVLYSTLVALYLDPPLERLFGVQFGLSTGTTDVLVLVTQTFIASAIVLVFGEIIPKSLARETANRAVFVLGLPLRVVYWLLWVLVKLAGSTSAMLARLFRSDAEDFAQFMRRDFEILLQEHRDIEVNPGADEDDDAEDEVAVPGEPLRSARHRQIRPQLQRTLQQRRRQRVGGGIVARQKRAPREVTIEASGRTLDVYVDGTVRGKTPWEAKIDATSRASSWNAPGVSA